EIVDPGFLARLAVCRRQRRLTRVDEPFREVPQFVRAQHEKARPVRGKANDHESCRALRWCDHRASVMRLARAPRSGVGSPAPRADDEKAMIDHTGISVRDIKKSKAFYTRALAPIGYTLLAEFPASVTGGSDVAGVGVAPRPDFWIASGTSNVPPIHVAFRVEDRRLVDEFHKAAM